MTRRVAFRRAGLASATVALASVLHACGDDETDATATVPDEETSTVPRTTLEPLATPAGTPGATPAGTPAAGETHVVEMNDELQFDPARLKLRVGDTVSWRTVGAVPHTSTCDPEEAQNPEESVQLPEGAETWNSGTVEEGEEFQRTFEVAGEYTYFCIPHETSGMIGYLTVEE